MTKMVLFKNYKTNIFLICLLFFIISAFFYNAGNFFFFRLMRSLVGFSLLLFLVFMLKKKVPLVVFSFLMLYNLSSLATVKYEIPFYAILSMFLNLFAFLVLTIHLLPKVSFKKMNTYFILSFILMVVLNGYLTIQFVNMFRGFSVNETHSVVIVVIPIVLVFTIFLAFLYNHKVNSNASMAFLCFVIIIITFSGTFRAIAYYEMIESNLSVYIERLLLVIGLGVITHYAFIYKKEDTNLKLEE